jgi:hypothetical protein
MFNWKILEIFAKDGIVNAVKYSCEYEGIETEGICSFSANKAKIPFEQLNEGLVRDWVKKKLTIKGTNLVEANLAKQVAGLDNKVQIPWRAPTFTPFGE